MDEQKGRKVSGWTKLVTVGALAALSGGCAFIPTPVRLADRPFSSAPLPAKHLNICTVVYDDRSPNVQKSNMCGVMRNGYMIPTSFAFLAHSEHLDAILSHHTKKMIENAGYTVVQSYPKAPEVLSAKKVQAKELDQSAKKAAWENKSSLTDDAEREAAKSEKNKNSTTDSDVPLEVTKMGPWDASVDLCDADYVMEIRVKSFSSDATYVGVFGWMKATVAVCAAKDPQRTVLYGKQVKGYGWGTGISMVEAYTIPLNMAYWNVLGGIDKSIRSSECAAAIISSKERQQEKSNEVMATPASSEPPAVETPKTTSDIPAQLEKLKDLKSMGLLTDEEYEARRQALSSQL